MRARFWRDEEVGSGRCVHTAGDDACVDEHERDRVVPHGVCFAAL